MKKVLAICMMIAMVVSMNTGVFAAEGGFVSSPTGNPAPVLDDFTPSDESFEGEVVVESYADRENLPEEIRESFEKAYDDIAKADDLTELNVKDDLLAKTAADKKVETENLAVSDLFDIHVTGSENVNYEGKSEFKITLSADTLNSLLHCFI